MKILELDGHKYSLKSFPDYKFRAKILIKTIDCAEPHNFDIYTTDGDRESVENVLLDRKAERVTSLQITYWCTKEQDDIAAKMIDEWLKE